MPEKEKKKKSCCGVKIVPEDAPEEEKK